MAIIGINNRPVTDVVTSHIIMFIQYFTSNYYVFICLNHVVKLTVLASGELQNHSNMPKILGNI